MNISRRRFLGSLAASGVGALAARPAAAAENRGFPGHPGRLGLLHDTTLCVGCRSCEAGCRKVNGHPPPDAPIDDKAIFGKRRRTSPQSFTVVNRYRQAEGTRPAVYRKHQCMHCNEPCCASVCFVKAFSKTPEGPVLYDPSVCVGCRYCLTACPYHALSYEYDKPWDPAVVRCTMCYPLIKEGKSPACADGCPTGAITFGKRRNLIEVARRRIDRQPGRYIAHIYGEHEFGGTSWLVLAGVPFGLLDLHEGATHTSLPEFSKGFLGVVPLVLTIWPGLLLGFYAFSRRRERLAQRELEAAVAAAVARADEETKKKLAAAAASATKAQERAVAQAVQKALAEEAAKKKQPEGSP